MWGGLSDRYGRRTALFLALAALHIGQFTSALAPNYWVYLVARRSPAAGAAAIECRYIHPNAPDRSHGRMHLRPRSAETGA